MEGYGFRGNQGGVVQIKVVGIADGDTLMIVDPAYRQHKIWLARIDAPEKKQPFGNVSQQHLSDMCFQKAVRVCRSSLEMMR